MTDDLLAETLLRILAVGDASVLPPVRNQVTNRTLWLAPHQADAAALLPRWLLGT